MPKLSIIVPVYNTETYLRECIDSILAQTFTDFELILVNDGSTDGSGSICDEYARTDDRVRVAHLEKVGVTCARKCGVEMSVGEYITFVDSDDWIDREMYRTMLSNAPADIYICGMVAYTANGADKLEFSMDAGSYDKQKLQETFYSKMLFDYAHCGPTISPSFCNKLIRREIIRGVINAVDNSITFCEDALCTYACMLDAERICIVDRALYYYRKNPTSVCNTYNEKLFSKMILLGSELQRLFAERGFDAEHQAYGYLARHSLECIRGELLYHSNASYLEKRRKIMDYMKHPLIDGAFRYALLHIRERKTRLKMLLAVKGMIGLLYILYIGRRFLNGGKKHDD